MVANERQFRTFEEEVVPDASCPRLLRFLSLPEHWYYCCRMLCLVRPAWMLCSGRLVPSGGSFGRHVMPRGMDSTGWLIEALIMLSLIHI